MGLLPLQGGTVTVCGNDLSRMAERQRACLHPAALGILGARERLAPAVFSAFAGHVVEKMRLMCKIFLFGVGVT